MRWPTASLPTVGVLFGLCANTALLAEVAMQLFSDGPAPIEKIDWKVDLTGSTADVSNQKPLAGYREIPAHPVFFKSRQPFVPAPPPPPVIAVVPPAVSVDPGLTVGGVMIRNSQSRAYLFSKAGLGGSWASEGEMFQGWKVRSISKTGVKLEQSGRSVELSLYPSN